MRQDPQQQHSSEQIAEMIKLYKKGVLVRVIEEQCQISKGGLYRHLGEAGVKLRRPGERGTKIDYNDVLRTVFLYHTLGLSLRDTANVLNLASTSSVTYRLRLAGRPPRGRHAAQAVHKFPTTPRLKAVA